jgi:membrane-associated phospholipid phosphatase
MKTISLKKRIALVSVPVMLQLLYLPTSRYLTGGIVPRIPLDSVVPIWPIWVVPYMMVWPIWIVAYAWAALRMQGHLFRVAVVSATFTIAMGMTIFMLYPTYVIRPVLAGTDFFSHALRTVYANDGTYDAAPSGHVYMTTLLALFYSLWYPKMKWLWMSILIIVCLSTVFTGQHYIMDVVTGLILGVVGYYAGFWIVDKWDKKEAQTEPDQEPSSKTVSTE